MTRLPLRKVSKKRQAELGNWSTVKAIVHRRDAGCCGKELVPEVRCDGTLDVHHLLRRSQGGKDTPSNLVVLCQMGHHRWVHEHPAEARERGLLR